MKFEEFLEQNKDLYDERKACFCAVIKEAPNGEYGLCLLAFKQNQLSVYDIDFQHHLGRKIYEITLAEVEDVKTSSFLFNPYLKFTYSGGRFAFKDFGLPKRVVEVFLQESGERASNR